MTDVTALISTEATHLQDFVSRFDNEAWSRPSACTGWTVGDVFAHLTQGASTWSDTIIRALAGDASPPPGQPPLRPGERGSEATAQRAIAYRQEMGTEALQHAFTVGYQRLHQLLQGLRAEDWDKPCYHRRGILPARDYAGLRLQELTMHGWDIRSAFDAAASLPTGPLPIQVGIARRWLSNAFRPDPRLTAPIRYRFDVPGPTPVRQDIVASPDGVQFMPATDGPADVTFRCHTGDYLLFVYGRLPVDRAVHTGRLKVEGNPASAQLFTTLFQGV
jgi:uncharacterized protein (TIGR03083 family)